MDLSEKYKFGLEKRIEDHMNYQTSTLSSEWQFNNQSIDSSIANPMTSSSPCPPVSMVNNFCSNIYNQSTNPQNPNAKPLPMGWGAGILPPSLSHFPIDSGLTKRAARFSCFGGGNFGGMANALYSASEPLSPYSGMRSPMNEQRDNKGSTNESVEAEFSGDGQEDAPDSSCKGIGAKKRKRTNQEVELDKVQGGNSSATEENMDTKQKFEHNSSTMAVVKHSAKDGPDGPKEDYIHVRARRGQATNSHSLAERVRREKISERMKLLQDLVPGCSKVTGKAVMLDEIINYVQSLQRQVEFLSMKLATVNPRLDFNIEGLLSKDIFHLRGGPSSAIGFLPDMSHLQIHPSQQSLLQAGIPGMANPSDGLRRAVNAQLTPMTGYKESAPQMVNAWDEDLHNIVQMTFGATTSMNTSELIGKPRDSFPL